MNYSELRSANATAYCRQNSALFGLVPTWGPLWNCARAPGGGGDPASLFNRCHDEIIKAIDAQQQAAQPVDWSQTYAAVKPLLDNPAHLAKAIHRSRESLANDSRENAREVLATHIRTAFREAGIGHLVHRKWDATRDTSIDPAALIATIITAVLAALCPPTAAFSALIQPVLTVIIKVLFDSLSSSFSSGKFGASPAEFANTVHQWATEAGAAA